MAFKKSTQNHSSKKIPETDEIFKNLKEVNARADSSTDELRMLRVINLFEVVYNDFNQAD